MKERERKTKTQVMQLKTEGVPEGPRSRATSGHRPLPQPCHRQRGILRQQAQLEIDGRGRFKSKRKRLCCSYSTQQQQPPAVLVVSVAVVPPRPRAESVHQSSQPELRSSIESLAFRLPLSFFASILSPSKSIDPTSTPILNNSFRFV